MAMVNCRYLVSDTDHSRMDVNIQCLVAEVIAQVEKNKAAAGQAPQN
jgi:hypothetical protein